MSMRNNSNSNMNRDIKLPYWIFDVDSEDEYESNDSLTLLEELDIDLIHIYKNIGWMLTAPLCFLLRRPMDSIHPLQSSHIAAIVPLVTKSSRNTLTSTSAISSSLSSTKGQIDFWGPCTIVSLYGAILWIGNVRDVPWIYIIWLVASIFNHFICRVWFTHPKLLLHSALLGYSVAPILPLTIIHVLFHPPFVISVIIILCSLAWSSFAAIMAYSVICSNASQEERQRLLLLIPSIVLMEAYLLSLLPLY